jgi:hypothetical protein
MQIMLPKKSVRLHETAPTMEAQSIINRMYGEYNVRPGYMYPASPYRRSLGIRGLRGLGFNYYDLLNEAGLENCDPKDTPCTMRNSEKEVAVEDLWVSQYMSHPETANQPAPQIHVNVDTSADALARYKDNQPITSDSVTVNQGAPTGVYTLEHTPYSGGGAGGGGGSYSPRVSMRTSTGDTGQLKPGDTWTISITGGKPNSPVVVVGGQNGRKDTTPMGNTDGYGNWQATGAIDTSTIGNWSEDWSVAGQSAGNISFTVVPASQAQGSAATGKANQSVPPGNPLVPGDTGFNSTGSFLDKLFGHGGTAANTGSDNSTLLLIGLGVAALFLMTKGK